MVLEAPRTHKASVLLDGLDGYEKSVTIEDYLRRIDGAILLTDHGISSDEREQLLRRREEVFKEALIS